MSDIETDICNQIATLYERNLFPKNIRMDESSYEQFKRYFGGLTGNNRFCLDSYSSLKIIVDNRIVGVRVEA